MRPNFMNTKTYKIVIAVSILVILGAGIFFLGKDTLVQEEKGKISVVASFYPLAYLATAVGGELITVVNLTPPGAEPHDFDPSPRDIEMLSRAHMFIYNGGGLEPWVEGWKNGAFKHPPLTINMINKLKEGGEELIERGGATDPHVWLDPSMLKKEAEIIRDALILADPSHAKAYRDNTARLVGELGVLDTHYRDTLAACKLHDMIVSHEAFSYLGRAYDISVISIAGISPDEEPSSKTIAFISDVAREKNIKYIFYEAIASPKLSETIAREIGAETLVLNTLESLTIDELRGGEDYTSVMEQNLNNLKKAFVCQ